MWPVMASYEKGGVKKKRLLAKNGPFFFSRIDFENLPPESGDSLVGPLQKRQHLPPPSSLAGGAKKSGTGWGIFFTPFPPNVPPLTQQRKKPEKGSTSLTLSLSLGGAEKSHFMLS